MRVVFLWFNEEIYGTKTEDIGRKCKRRSGDVAPPFLFGGRRNDGGVFAWRAVKRRDDFGEKLRQKTAKTAENMAIDRGQTSCYDGYASLGRQLSDRRDYTTL